MLENYVCEVRIGDTGSAERHIVTAANWWAAAVIAWRRVAERWPPGAVDVWPVARSTPTLVSVRPEDVRTYWPRKPDGTHV